VPEQSKNVWSPWRMQYIEGLGDDDGCFLCQYRDDPASDADNHVVWRTDRSLVVLNRFPYTGGHLLVAPAQHVPAPEDLDESTLCELTMRMRDAKRVLERALGAEGFNFGLNLGRCAGAGLPDHMHWHIVPRWSGDTNYMAVSGEVRVIPIALQSVYDKFLAVAHELGLP
jgi:ATP adenylyltransferase